MKSRFTRPANLSSGNNRSKRDSGGCCPDCDTKMQAFLPEANNNKIKQAFF